MDSAYPNGSVIYGGPGQARSRAPDDEDRSSTPPHG